MASVKVFRKDANGQVISKNDKNYHISFNDNIDIIDVQSYKKYNHIYEDYEEEENEDVDTTTETNFIESYQKANIEVCPSKDPKAFSKGGCYIF